MTLVLEAPMHCELAFSFSIRSLVARAKRTRDGWEVRVYENARPATAVTYTVSYNTAIDAQMSGHSDLVEHLLQVARDDLERGYVRLLDLAV
jgi:hypothetical protein